MSNSKASTQSLVLATSNKGKVAELSDLLLPFGWQVRPQNQWEFEDAEETGLTFVENAIIKARHACQQTGLPALADDSGLAVDALNGAPGIYSARYAGPGASDTDNVDKLLHDMDSVADSERTARFICALVFMRHAEDPTPLICQGQWQGEILRQPRGQGGFGYDPVFYVPDHQCSAAELESATKQAISHRGQALIQLRSLLSI